MGFSLWNILLAVHVSLHSAKHEKTSVIIYFFIHYSGTALLVSAYRDKNSVSDFTLAGILTGTLFKTHLGMKGMISGGFFGAILGSIGGSIFLGSLKLFGLSLKDYAEMQTYYMYARDKAVHESQVVNIIYQIKKTLISHILMINQFFFIRIAETIRRSRHTFRNV